MRKLTKTALSAVLATSMVVGQNPAISFAQVAQMPSGMKASDNKTTASYKEGEALVLYKSTGNKVSAKNVKELFGADIAVVDTWDFSAAGTVSKKSEAAADTFAISLVKTTTGESTKQLIKRLSQQENVEMAEPNYRIKLMNTTKDPYEEYQWALDNQGQNGGTEGSDLNAEALAGKEKDKKEKVIALVDTGIDYTNEDLKDVVWNNPNTKKLKGAHGFDFINYDADPLDDNGHGSHCSGIMAGKAGNGKGISGIATDDNIRIMALKILDAEGYGYGDEAIGAYNYIYKAQQMGVNVVSVNNSWGGGEESEIFKKLINLVGEAGAVSVCAAGNSAENTDEVYTFPANVDSPYIISVAATTEKDELATFSCYGKETVDIAAPGADILSTVSYDCFNPSIYEDKAELCNTYEDFSGKLVSSGAIGVVSPASQKANEIVYGIDGPEDNVSVALDKQQYFGKKGEDASSLVWKVKDASEGEKYVLTIPYKALKSTTPVHISGMFKINAPELDQNDWFAMPSLLNVSDAEIKEDGTLSNIKNLGSLYAYDASNYWNHCDIEAAKSMKKDGNRALVLELEVSAAGDFEICFDDFGVSKSDVKTEKFGKYDFFNGTSMATPYVTGAVAALANLYPDATAEELRARVLGSTRTVKGLEGKVATAGILDLSKVDNPSPNITKASLNKEGNVVVNGYFFGKNAAVTVNGKAAEILSQDDKTIVLKGTDLANKKIEVTVAKEEKKTTNTFFLTTGKDYDDTASIEDIFWGGNMVTDGNFIYYVHDAGNVYSCNPNEGNTGMDDFVPPVGMVQGTKDAEALLNMIAAASGSAVEVPTSSAVKQQLSWNTLGDAFDAATIFGEEMSTVVQYDLQAKTGVVACNKKLYTVVSMDTGYTVDYALVSFDTVKGSWVKVANIPAEFEGVIGSTLAAYDGNLMLAGGYSTDNEKGIQTVKVYNVEKENWADGKALPEARSFAKAMQVEDKLVLTLGADETKQCPGNLIFDGTNWKVGAKLENALNQSSYTYQLPEVPKNVTESAIEVIENKAYKTVNYYNAEIGLIDGGIIYAGLKADGLGDTYNYNLAKDKFLNVDYSLNVDMSKKEVHGTCVGDKFYVMYGEGFAPYEEEEYYAKKQDSMKMDYDSMMFEDYNAKVATVPVSNGAINVIDKTMESGVFAGIVSGAGAYLPGDTIKLEAVATSNDYCAEGLMVNGVAVEGGIYTAKATKALDNLSVQGIFSSYVSMIELDQMFAEVEEGKSVQLKATTFPMDAKNATLVWASSDESIATVTQKGKVTVKANNAGKTVTITATAKDRNTVAATCEISVIGAAVEPTVQPSVTPAPQKVKVKKITLKAAKKTVKAGKTVKITATVTPKKATNKKLTWTTSNKKYATVTQSGKVKTKKAGKGKTVKITATAKDGSKIKATIKIKIK